MRTNNNNLVDFSSKQTYVASESLLQEAKDKHSDIYLNFVYTDYGGSFLDKVIISYFKEYYPENIVHEKTSYNGENAFIFGEPAKELYNLMKVDNVLGFDDLEDYYTEMEYNVITEEAQRYINDNELGNDTDYQYRRAYLLYSRCPYHYTAQNGCARN